MYMCPVCVSAASMCVHMSGVCTDISSSERCTVRDTMIVTTVLSCPAPSLPPLRCQTLQSSVFWVQGPSQWPWILDLGSWSSWNLESWVWNQGPRYSERVSEYLKLDANIWNICYEYNSNETNNKLKRRKNNSVREKAKKRLHVDQIMQISCWIILHLY